MVTSVGFVVAGARVQGVYMSSGLPSRAGFNAMAREGCLFFALSVNRADFFLPPPPPPHSLSFGSPVMNGMWLWLHQW